MKFDPNKTLRVKWSRKENDLECEYPVSVDCNYVWYKIFSKEVQEELEKRGYDLHTLKFSMDKKEK